MDSERLISLNFVLIVPVDRFDVGNIDTSVELRIGVAGSEPEEIPARTKL